MSKVLFKETIQINNYISIAIGALSLIIVLKGISLLTLSHAFKTNALFLLLTGLSLALLTYYLLKIKLKVAISEKSVKFKLSPIHLKKRSIRWKEIEKYEIIKTPTLAQWSGGNISFNHEKMYTLTGRNGISITTNTGEHYFIGCKNVSLLQQVLQSISKK